MNKIYSESDKVMYVQPSRPQQEAELTDRIMAVFCKHLVRVIQHLYQGDDEKNSDAADMLREYANALYLVSRNAAADLQLLEPLCAQDEHLLCYPDMSSDQRELCTQAVITHIKKSLPGMLRQQKICLTHIQKADLNKAISQVVETVLNPSSGCCTIL